jgi:gluconolactonase
VTHLTKGGVRKIAGGFTFTEGPVFSRRGYLLFSDIPQRIMKWERGKLTVFRGNSNGANGLTFDHQGRLLACEGNGRVTRTGKNGSITALAARGLHRPNDIVYAIDGNTYFTDLLPPESKERSRVYQITRTGELRVATEECSGPNGVALSPNQQKLYVADSFQRNIRVFDLAADGSPGSGRIFAESRCAGLKTDEDGNVWVASHGSIRVCSASGKELGTIPVPEEPSNCCWGEGFRGLYITAQTSVYWVQTKVTGTRTY